MRSTSQANRASKRLLDAVSGRENRVVRARHAHYQPVETGFSNEELIAALGAALQKEGKLIANEIAMLIEVEERRLHFELACPSMFEFLRETARDERRGSVSAHLL